MVGLSALIQYPFGCWTVDQNTDATRCESLNLVSADISFAVLISSINAKFNHTLKNISDFFLNVHKNRQLESCLSS